MLCARHSENYSVTWIFSVWLWIWWAPTNLLHEWLFTVREICLTNVMEIVSLGKSQTFVSISLVWTLRSQKSTKSWALWTPGPLPVWCSEFFLMELLWVRCQAKANPQREPVDLSGSTAGRTSSTSLPSTMLLFSGQLDTILNSCESPWVSLRNHSTASCL